MKNSNYIKAAKLALEKLNEATDHSTYDSFTGRQIYDKDTLNAMPEDAVIAYLKKQPRAIGSITNQTEKMAMTAVKANADALQYVKNQTEKVCRTALRRKAYSFIHIKPENVTEELCMFAVKQTPSILKLIDREDQTDKVCLAAIESAKYPIQVVKFIRDPARRAKMFKIADGASRPKSR